MKALVLVTLYFGVVLCLVEDFVTDGERRQNG